MHGQQITQTEMDFTEMDEDELELKEDEQIYPPKFRVVISCSPAAQQSQARIEFKGAHKDLVFDIPLAPQSEPGINLYLCRIIQPSDIKGHVYTQSQNCEMILTSSWDRARARVTS